MSDHLLLEVSDAVATITFNRPEKHNAVSPEFVEAMLAATHHLENDPAVRCVLVRAEGDSFMAGGDVIGFQRSLSKDRAGYAAGMERRIVTGHLMIHRLRRMGKPVVAAVQGPAIGFGLGLVCAADYVIASERAGFALGHRHVGLTSDGGVSYFLPRIIGQRRALEMALFGERIDAATALAWGLVNRVVPDGALLAEAAAVAAMLARGPTAALGGAKRLFRESFDCNWDEQSSREAESLARMSATDDHLEGVAAFVEKRRPRFTGR